LGSRHRLELNDGGRSFHTRPLHIFHKVGQPHHGLVWAIVLYKTAQALTAVNTSLVFKGLQGPAYRYAAYTKLFGKFIFRWKLFINPIATGFNLLAHPIADLLMTGNSFFQHNFIPLI